MNTTPMKFEDAVKEKLKSIVADLIPEDRWDALVVDTIRQFEKDDLPKLVKAELIDFYKAQIKAEFEKPEWQGTWANGMPNGSLNVSKLIQDAAPLILANLIGGSMQMVVQDLMYKIQNMPRGY